MKDELTAAAVKSAPPVTIVGIETLSSLTLDDWVKIATLLYVVLQAAFLLHDRLRKWGAK